jgi:hypothetical protein
MPKFKKNPSPFQMKGMTFQEGQTPMKNLNSPLHNGLGDLFKGIFSAAEGAVKGVVQAGTGIIKGVTTDIKEGIEQVKENRAKRQSQKSTTQSSSKDDKKTKEEKLKNAIGAGFTAAGERMGGHIDKPEIIQTGSTSGEQSTTVPDVTTIITSKESNIKPISYTKKSKRTTSKWGFDYDEEEDNPITKKSGFKMKKSPYKNYKKGYYGVK